MTPESTGSDYSHRFHVGNAGDVLKHAVLLEALAGLTAGSAPLTYVETHAGEGLYTLGSTGGVDRGRRSPGRDAARH